MKNKSLRLLSVLFVLIILISQVSIQAVAAADAKSIADDIIQYNLDEASAADIDSWIDTALTEGAGESAEWYVIALSQYGDYDFGAYRTVLLEYLDENDIGSASSQQKIALALIASGSDDSYIYEVLDNSIAQQGIMSYIYGLHLLNNGYESDEFTLSKVIDELISMQLYDGGFAVMGTNGEVDATAMAIQALSPYYDSDASVKECIDNALDYLSSSQNETGDFSSYGVNNPESTAQVLIALSSLGIDAADDERFIKNGNTLFDGISLYAMPDGSYSHTVDGDLSSIATVQVFCSMVSYIRMKNEESAFYIFEKDIYEDAPLQESTSTTALTSTVTTVSTSTAQTTDSVTSTESEESSGGYKLWVSLAIAVAALIICYVMHLAKRRNCKNFAVVIAFASICVLVVVFTDIKSANEHYDSDDSKQNVVGTVSISIYCDEIQDKSAEHIPDDGVILENCIYEIRQGETVYDILIRATSANKIHLETSSVGTVYVEGIANIYEFDFGELSGWMYYVNGEKPSVGCTEYELSDGDEIEWRYTCSLGEDM